MRTRSATHRYAVDVDTPMRAAMRSTRQRGASTVNSRSISKTFGAAIDPPSEAAADSGPVPLSGPILSPKLRFG